MSSTTIATAAILAIGDELLSGRTKDKNIGQLADMLFFAGIDLKEVRIVGDEEDAIVLNAEMIGETEAREEGMSQIPDAKVFVMSFREEDVPQALRDHRKKKKITEKAPIKPNSSPTVAKM